MMYLFVLTGSILAERHPIVYISIISLRLCLRIYATVRYVTGASK